MNPHPFITIAISTACIFSFLATLCAAPLAIHLRELPLLFADDNGIASSTGAVRTMHVAKTRSAPVIEADARVYVYGSVYSEDGLLRLWYLARPKGDQVLYTTSQDGLNWLRGTNVFNIHSPSVLLDTRETDPAKRYKMLGAKSGGYHAAFSSDGLQWSWYPKNPVLKESDTITLTQDPVSGEYMAFHKRYTKVRGFGRRVVWLARSRDFQEWSEPELVFAPDEKDDVWAGCPGQRTEVYPALRTGIDVGRMRQGEPVRSSATGGR